MIISDRYQFAFVHIPKCAGTTLRHALAPFDEVADRYHDKAVTEHPMLGPLDYPHIPLAVLAEHFAEDFSRLDHYRSFALVRDPFQRFPSSLHERLIQRDRKPLDKLNKAEIAREVDAVLEKLSRHTGERPITDPAFIHFSRQKDYIFLDRQQVVKTIRTVDEVADVLSEISMLVGWSIRPEESKNRRLYHAYPVVDSMQMAIARPIEKALPRRVWKPVFKQLKAVFVAAGLLRHAGNPLAELPNAGEIDAFITEFYADDIHLFEKANAARRGRTTTSRQVS